MPPSQQPHASSPTPLQEGAMARAGAEKGEEVQGPEEEGVSEEDRLPGEGAEMATMAIGRVREPFPN